MNTVHPDELRSILGEIERRTAEEFEARRAANCPVNAPHLPFYVNLHPAQWAIVAYALGLYEGACRKRMGP